MVRKYLLAILGCQRNVVGYSLCGRHFRFSKHGSGSGQQMTRACEPAPGDRAHLILLRVGGPCELAASSKWLWHSARLN